MSDELTVEDIKRAVEQAEAHAKSPENLRDIVERLAAMDGREVSMLELTALVLRAKQAVS